MEKEKEIKIFVNKAWQICQAENDSFERVDFPLSEGEYISIKFWGSPQDFTVTHLIWIDGVCYEEILWEEGE